MEYQEIHQKTARFGYFISKMTALMTAITLGIAIGTPPLSGPFCNGSCFQYPYSEIISRFPRDYFWIYPAILVTFFYLIMMISVYQISPIGKKLYATIAVAFAMMSTQVLSVNYFNSGFRCSTQSSRW